MLAQKIERTVEPVAESRLGVRVFSSARDMTELKKPRISETKWLTLRKRERERDGSSPTQLGFCAEVLGKLSFSVEAVEERVLDLLARWAEEQL